MLLGLIRPDAGSAKLFGRDPLEEGARALDGVAGFVEAPRFYPYLTGRRNLELVAALDGGGAAGRIDEALDTVDLADRANDRVGGYSHGMRQRLGIAGALLRDPRLLLLDEPTTGLDPGGMRDMRRLVRRLAGQGITVLLSSHLMAEVEELCDRVAIVGNGRVLYEGSLPELIATDRRPLRAAHDRRRPRRRDRRVATPASSDVEAARRRPHVRRRRATRSPRCRSRSARPASGSARCTRDRHARGAVLPDDRGHERRGDRDRPRARSPAAAAAAAPRHRAPCYRWELRKLVAQKRTFLGLGAAVAVPLIFVVALLADSGGGPEDVPFGEYVRESGLAIPLVCLFFGSIWLLPLITALVAGDIVATEDHNGTLKTILTRSVERWQVFAGKVLAALLYTSLALFAYVGVGVVAGGLVFGFDPLTLAVGHDRRRRRGALPDVAGTLAYAAAAARDGRRSRCCCRRSRATPRRPSSAR